MKEVNLRRRTMNAVRAALATLVLLMGIWANVNPDVLEDWLSSPAPSTSVQSELVGLQESEEWLVLRVDFSRSPVRSTKGRLDV